MEMFESGIHQVFVKLLDGKHKILNFNAALISVPTLKSRIQTLTSVPSHLQLLRLSNSRILHDHQTLALAESRELSGIPETLDFISNDKLPRDQSFGGFREADLPARVFVKDGSGDVQCSRDRDLGKFPLVVHLLLRLRGGKGGFGSLLRGAATKAGQKKTNNFDACRDMSGRRLRHVNAEKKLEEWRAEADERKLERMAEEFLKKKAKEVAKSGKSKGGDSAEKYVAKYREDSALCMEKMERSVRESIKESVNLKRKGGSEEAEAKRLKIWLGKRKLGDSDSEDSDEGENEGEENAKSVVTDNGNHSDSSKETEGTSDSVTCDNLDTGSVDKGSCGSHEEDTVGEESPRLDDCQDGSVGDGKFFSRNKPAFESFEDIIIHQDGVEMEAPHKSNSCTLEEMPQQPVVSIPEKVDTFAAEVGYGTISEPVEKVSVPLSPKVQDLDEPLNLDLYNSAAELEVLGLEKLKLELQARGLKCGGTLHERAARLFMLKSIPLEMLPRKLFAKK